MNGKHVHDWYYCKPEFNGSWWARRYCKGCFIIETFDLKDVTYPDNN